MHSEELKKSIIAALIKQGYKVNGDVILPPDNSSKADYRRMNELAVDHKLQLSAPRLKRHEKRLNQLIADGSEVVPECISPKIFLVQPKSEHELLFRYLSLHWSIPVSAGYGRRLRFIVFDQYNGKVIGILGLGDPVFSLKNRDESIGWDNNLKKEKLYHLMDAFVLGAVPPYSNLICGKLIAMLALSNEVRDAFRCKYFNKESLIKKKIRPPYLAALTTTSALGRSSIYNRIRMNGHTYWEKVGYTQGSGDFHFSNGVYHNMRSFVNANSKPTAKNALWGKGFRNKREVIKKCLSSVGLSTNLIYHGIKREIFVAQLGSESFQFMRGEAISPSPYDWPAEHLVQLFKDRWLLPRAKRKPEYLHFKKTSYKLWP